MALTDVQINNAKPASAPYRLVDGGALFLEVRPTGAKSWRYRYRIAGKQNIFVIGHYFTARKKPADHVSLEAARAERDRVRKLVKQGIHPAHQRREEKLRQHSDNANTFKGVAKEWIEKNPQWTAYYLSQIEKAFERDVYPYVGTLAIRPLSRNPAAFLAILQRVEKRGAKTVALLIKQWCSAVFRHAVVTLRADGDPTAPLRGLVKRDKVKHHAPLTRGQIPDIVQKIDTNTYRTTAIALHLLMRTFVRPGELRNAEWAEFDFTRAEWRIPAERMKMREMHIVPLSRQTIRFLEELKTITGGSKFLFPNYRRPETVMTITTLNRALERMGYGGTFSAHGFRSTASTMLSEMKYRADVIERQLAHAERNKSRAAYNQAEYLDERRELMQNWSDTIDVMASDKKVIPIGSKGKAA